MLRNAFLLLLLSAACVAQPASQPATASPPQSEPQLSPQSAYDQAVRPLDIVRRPVGNWSEVEQAALKVAKAEATTACAARSPYQYQGEDLLAFAHLCAFADIWQPVQQAAYGYLIAQNLAKPEDKLTGFPGLSMAFDYEVQASLHLKNTANAFGSAQSMLRTVAYDDLASEASNGFVRYVQLIQTDEALVLLQQRQPILLALLKARGAPTQPASTLPDAATLVPSPRPPMATHDLYADAIMLPAMLQFMDKPDEAATALADLDASLPANLSPDDSIFIASSHQQYRLLGSPLPPIGASASLLDLAMPAAPDLNRKDAGAIALLLFPDWCAQCVAMDVLFVETATNLKNQGFHFQALLAQADPNPPAPPTLQPLPPPKTAIRTATATSKLRKPVTAAKPEVPHVEINAVRTPTIADQLVGTPTLIVPNKLLDTFAATDFPLLVVTDGHGMVRYIGIAPDNVLVDGGLIYQVVQRVNEQWPIVRHTQGTQP